jgi:hypothetical protein
MTDVVIELLLLRRTESIKSLEGYSVAWIDEA